MDKNIITRIRAFGLETITYTYNEDYGYGCAECCNGDRCDEDCTAKYRRHNSPHCKGKGWIKKEDVEPKDIQLPYIDAIEFNNKVAAFAETNLVLKHLFNNPKSKIKNWEQLPTHLIQDLFKKLGCKPSIQKY